MLEVQVLAPTIAQTTATLVGVMAAAAGVRSIVAPQPFAESFGFPQKQAAAGAGQQVDPFIPVVGVRNIATGLSVLAFSALQNRNAMGVVMLCNLASMLGDTIICWNRGTKGSANHHLVASVVFATLGGYLCLV